MCVFDAIERLLHSKHRAIRALGFVIDNLIIPDKKATVIIKLTKVSHSMLRH